jgi:hypothetical protein
MTVASLSSSGASTPSLAPEIAQYVFGATSRVVPPFTWLKLARPGYALPQLSRIIDIGARTMTIPVPPLVADVNEGTITVVNVVAFGMTVVTASMSIVRLSATPVSELFLVSVAGHTSCSRTRFDGLRK